MKIDKKITIINIILLFFNIIMLIITIYFTQSKVKPQLQLYDWSGEYISIQPLLTEYTKAGDDKTSFNSSERVINNYLNSENKLIQMFSFGVIRLDFWELGVVKVTATIDDDPVTVRRTDGQYFIDFESKDTPMTFIITSIAENGIAKYTFRILMNETGEAHRINESKEVILNETNIEKDDIYLCGYEKFIPYSDKEGYVFKTVLHGSDNEYITYGVDIITRALFTRDIKGNYMN